MAVWLRYPVEIVAKNAIPLPYHAAPAAGMVVWLQVQHRHDFPQPVEMTRKGGFW
jgi:hypothetical protein